ncbi:MGDG synthase family glycosyltransferase [Paenibacillus faecalis]|uniref:MGDG synthase family glycosyltransferase n=1 Tax=Paenibacillus faecalis TaxID=2079532 RepID=UPI000D10795B|nr:glycosyltransferase [Paenibacillus faecalis]
MAKKRVLLLSEGFGAGHTQAAYALSSSLRQLSPNIQTKVMELGSFLNPKMAPLIISAYRKTLTSRPRLFGYVYRHKKSFSRFTALALHRIFYTSVKDVVKQLRPDIIVCTHFIPNAVISRLKRLGTNIPLCTVITDYDAHDTWISPEVDRYFVSTPEVERKLLNRGVSQSKIQVTGIPIHPDFWKHPSKDEIRKKFNLAKMPTVLVMGGGWGLMNDKVVHEYLTRWREEIQVIFCFGNNDRARMEMEENPRFRHPNIRIFGFTREVDKLMEVSDLLITKPGGMTCTEGLAKGIPMLFHHPLPGQEEENFHYFVAQGLGEPISSLEVLGKWMNMLLNEYDEILLQRSRNLEDIQRYHPLQSAMSIIEMLENEKAHS